MMRRRLLENSRGWTRHGLLLPTTVFALSTVPLAASGFQVVEFRLVASTRHFDVTCALALDRRVDEIAAVAEGAYERISKNLRHDLSHRPLLVLFASQQERDRAVRTRTVPGNREHLLVTLDAFNLEEHLTHDLSHVFLFDMVPGATRKDFPRWISEGLAEFQRGRWDAADLQIVNGMMDHKAIPRFQTIGDDPRSDARQDMVFGHAAFEFLVERAGPGAPRRLLTSLRHSRSDDAFRAYVLVLGIEPADLDRAFVAFLRTRFARR